MHTPAARSFSNAEVVKPQDIILDSSAGIVYTGSVIQSGQIILLDSAKGNYLVVEEGHVSGR